MLVGLLPGIAHAGADVSVVKMVHASPTQAKEAVHQTIPVNLYMPPNPPAPGAVKAQTMNVPHLLAQRTTNYRHASATQAKNIELLAKRLNGVIVKPGQVFSYYEHVGPYTAKNGYGWGRAFAGGRIIPSMGGGVCQGASTLYSALLRTGLPIVERHNHQLTVPYLPPGEDATVAASAHLNFRFKNNQTTPILITAATYPKERFLTIAIWGAKAGPDIQVKHRILAVYPYQTLTERHRNTTHANGHVIAPGQAGVKTDTWLSIKTAHGLVRKEIGIDTYESSPRIIEAH